MLRLHRWGAQNPKWYYITPASVWAVFIYVTCLIDLKPVEEMGLMPIFPGADKLAHFLDYAILSLLIIRGVNREKMPPLGLHAIVFTMCVVFGAMIEVQQLTTGYRSFDWVDIAADSAGAAAGLAAWQAIMMKWGKRTKLYPGLFRAGPQK